MTDLIKRLKAATEGSRELDGEIAYHVDGVRYVVTEKYDNDVRGPYPFINPYTTSIGAALTLVPEGWSTRLQIGGDEKTSTVCSLWHEDGRQIHDIGETPALSLCIAGLKARGHE